jgi:two-component system sensor histidine kinase BaeS
MLRSLRSQLILSHVLPLLIVLPIMGLVLVYVLETRVLLVNLARQLNGQAVLVAELTRESPGIWTDSTQAGEFVARVGPLFPAQLMLLAPDGTVLASSDPTDAGAVGRPLAISGLPQALAGESYSHVHYSQHSQAEVADVMVPAPGPDGRVAGVIRLTDQFGSVYERFGTLRYLIAEVLIVGLLTGVLAGLILAIRLERPLHQVTLGVRQLADGQPLAPLAERGPEEIRLLLHALNTLSERLSNLEQIRRHLLANLVHELGRPLGAMRAATHALLADGAAEEPALRQELLAGIDGEVGRLQRLMDDLDEFHDRVLGTFYLHRQPIALPVWLPQAIAPWRTAAQQAGLLWSAEVSSTLPVVSADPDRLAQALGNLLSNAVKYTPAGGEVRLAAGAANGFAWIRVSDTGSGLSPEELEHIFEPFYRARPARQAPQGMGLGLTIARDLAVAHGGRLEVESTPGVGSTFTLWLPVG